MVLSEKNKELIRFIICGLTAAIIDYLVSQLIILVLPTSLNSSLITGISSLIGFLVSVIFNYLLSTYWVYQNVDKSIKTNSWFFRLLFLIFSAIAMLLSIGTMILCEIFCSSILNIDIVSLSIMSIIKDYGFGFLLNSIFWAYAISFVLKTFVGLVFNFVTRKYILYKDQK